MKNENFVIIIVNNKLSYQTNHKLDVEGFTWLNSNDEFIAFALSLKDITRYIAKLNANLSFALIQCFACTKFKVRKMFI